MAGTGWPMYRLSVYLGACLNAWCSPQHNKSYKDVTIGIIIIIVITNEEIGNTCIERIECVVGNIETTYQFFNDEMVKYCVNICFAVYILSDRRLNLWFNEWFGTYSKCHCGRAKTTGMRIKRALIYWGNFASRFSTNANAFFVSQNEQTTN